MKTFIYACVLGLLITPVWGQSSLNQALPLLQQQTRTAQQTMQVLALFSTSQDNNLIFATGASLVKLPPTKAAEPTLLNNILRASNPLRTSFSAIILTAMGSMYEELTPILLDSLQNPDTTLRAYAAGAYALVEPTDTTYLQDIIRLYIFDPALAQRALHLVAPSSKEQLAALKKAITNPDAQVRSAAAAWLGKLHTQPAVNILLKRAKTEQDPSVQTQLATALAASADQALEGTVKGLRTSYTKPTSATYALALGFMTGTSIEALKNAITTGNQNQRINATRAAAYMAGILSNPDGFAYSSDRKFDTLLLKGLITPISALAQSGTADEQKYAKHALAQLEKLM